VLTVIQFDSVMILYHISQLPI